MTGQGIVIAGTHSGCGKTTLTLGIMAALKKKGLKVQSFKTGPDFIDSGLHGIITGRPSRNLDLWMCGEDYVRDCFQRHSADADVSVVEGVMGLYDGESSTATLADILGLPVILVVDAYGMGESAGAVVKGFHENAKNKMKKTRLTGVIFNNIASGRHFERTKESTQDVSTLGYLPRDLDFEIPDRHLGLMVAEENPITNENIQKLADAVLEHIDIDLLFQKCHAELVSASPVTLKQVQGDITKNKLLKIAIAYDKAFCFYYADNLDLLRDAGAELVRFSPLHDSAIPDGVDAVYIGGGYPELHAEELSRNASMLKSIYDWADSGNPIYAECGGLMYLSQGIYYNPLPQNSPLIKGDEGGCFKGATTPLPPFIKGEYYAMAGVFPFEIQMRSKLSRLGYREIELNNDCILGKKGDKLRGHEFHYSEIKETTQNTACHPVLDTESREGMDSRLRTAGMTEYRIHERIYSTKDNNGHDIQVKGYTFKNTLASYVHIHFGSNPGIADNFINFIKEYKWKA